MKNWPSKFFVAVAVISALSGCAANRVSSAATDLALTGAGGVIGYQVSNGRPEATAAGAVGGYLLSKAAQSAQEKSLSEAEKAGYDRALNQAVKQHYWIIQNQQKALAPAVEERAPRLVPIVIPESKINGVIINAHIEYLRVEP